MFSVRKKSSSELLDGLYIKDDEGRIQPVLFNIYVTLRFHDEWRGILNIDSADKSLAIIKVSDPPLIGSYQGHWTRTDTYLTTIWMQRLGIMVTAEEVSQAVSAAATTNSQAGHEPPADFDELILF